MKKYRLMAALLLGAALFLGACGGKETSPAPQGAAQEAAEEEREEAEALFESYNDENDPDGSKRNEISSQLGMLEGCS